MTTFFPEPETVFAGDTAMHKDHFLPLATVNATQAGLEPHTTLHFISPIEPCDGIIGEYTKTFHTDFCRPNWVAFDVVDNRYRFRADERFFLQKLLADDPTALRGAFPKNPSYETEIGDELAAHTADIRDRYNQAKQSYHQGKLPHDQLENQMFLGSYPADANWRVCSEVPLEEQQIIVSNDDYVSRWGAPAKPGSTDDIHTSAFFPLTTDNRTFTYVGSLEGNEFGANPCTNLLFYDPASKIALLTFDWT